MFRDNPPWVAVALDDNRRRSRLFDLGRFLPSAPLLPPGKVTITIEQRDACKCIQVSRGFAAADGSARTLHFGLSSRSFFALLPRAYGDYEVSALAHAHGRFVARSIDHDERFGSLGSSYLQNAAKSC